MVGDEDLGGVGGGQCDQNMLNEKLFSKRKAKKKKQKKKNFFQLK